MKEEGVRLCSYHLLDLFLQVYDWELAQYWHRILHFVVLGKEVVGREGVWDILDCYH